MMLKSFKTVIFTLLLAGSVIYLVSCEKEKIKHNNSSTEQIVLPDFCENCHNNTFPLHSTNAHSKHTKGLYTFNCTTCHYGHGWDTKTHMNAVKNITFDPNGLATRNGADSNIPTWDSDTKTCSNVYCHSNGVTADRGTDGTYTWSMQTPPFDTVEYATTPRWDNGKITACSSCHNGKGNMTSPYLVERPNAMTINDYPESGSHQKSAHMSNTQNFSTTPYSTPYWDGVQCFWCHSINATNETNINGPINQGTYGTMYHVDGSTFFKPLNISEGGTMANGMGYSSNGTAAHCGAGKTCW